MAAPEPTRDPGFLSSQQTRDSRSWLPWIIASAVVILGMAILVLAGRQSPSPPNSGTGMAPPAPYSSHLPISNLEMSQAASFSGAKVTYIDGQIANTGTQTIVAITVEVGFRNELAQLTDRESTPLNLIRTRQPYVDTEPVSANPIAPGQHRDFRLIFDTIPADWNQQEPEDRIIATRER